MKKYAMRRPSCVFVTAREKRNAENTSHTPVEIDLGQVEADQLRAPDSRGIEQLEEGPGPDRGRAISRYVQKAVDFLFVEVRRNSSLDPRDYTIKDIMLKRGMNSTIEEWLLAAEYILAEGNPNVILCERGIRTFESSTRNTLDLSAIPVVRSLSHLPIAIDPSHGTGRRVSRNAKR